MEIVRLTLKGRKKRIEEPWKFSRNLSDLPFLLSVVRRLDFFPCFESIVPVFWRIIRIVSKKIKAV